MDRREDHGRVDANDETVVDVPDPGLGSVDVKVTSADGKELPGAQVDLKGPLEIGGQSRDGGRARFDGLPPGKYAVSVAHAGFDRRTAQVGQLLSVQQPWNGRRMRIWIADQAPGKTVPLLVFLHGNIDDDSVGDAQMLATESELPKWSDAMNVANVAAELIKGGFVKPLVIAAPSEEVKRRRNNKVDAKGNKVPTTLFQKFKFSDVVETVMDVAGKRNVTIDLDDVALIGWSGSGGNPGMGLNLGVGDQGGEFKIAGTAHQLSLVGIADSRSREELSKPLQAGLGNKGPKTDVYALQKDDGGWEFPGRKDPSVVQPFANGFNAKTDLLGKQLPSGTGGKAVGDERSDQAAFDFYRVDDENFFGRTVARVRSGRAADKKNPADRPGLYKHTRFFHDIKAHLHADAAKAPPGTPGDELPGKGKPSPHRMVPLLWVLYALPRFFRP